MTFETARFPARDVSVTIEAVSYESGMGGKETDD